MSMHETVDAFAEAVGRTDGAPPPDVRVARGDLASRFAVYRNNVAMARIGAFADLFPVCRRLVGGDFFAAVVRAHLAEAPPTSPIVAEWGAGFATWLGDHAATRDLDWLVDIARLEEAWTRAFHAAEAEPLALERLVGLAPETLLAARLVLHPSLAVVASPHPIGAIWSAHQSDGDPAPLTTPKPETALVLRPQADVLVEVIGAADAVWLTRLDAGDDLARAGAAAIAVEPDFDLGARLVALVHLGAVVDLA